MKKKIWIALFLLGMLCMAVPVQAAEQPSAAKGRILFVPHDGRPISDAQTADVVRKLGYEVIVPPQELLGDRDNLGNPEPLWEWTEKEIRGVDAAVISSDSMLYGSLVGSRKHSYETKQVGQRAERFSRLRADNPNLPLYVFGSIMRTPASGANAGSEEPDYYQKYGSEIFRYTALTDIQETDGLSPQEQKERDMLLKKIPAEAMQDWMGRRAKNFAVNHKLIDLAKDGTFDYLILGKDDNAPHSQTHKESRELAKYAAGIDATRFQPMTGIDEMGMLLLTRAVNKLQHDVPFIYVRYNRGAGGAVIPAYSDERIDKSIRAEILAVGGIQVSSPYKADFVLAVNTNANGQTFETNMDGDELKMADLAAIKADAHYFADIVSGYLAEGLPVGVADIAFANGADNDFMKELQDRGLLFQLQAYAGWNTATNSAGFVMGEGILARYMTKDAIDQLLLNRYLEDWGYQANVRGVLWQQFGWLRDATVYDNMGKILPAAEARATRLLRDFAERNMPPAEGLQDLQLTFPWERGFEARIVLGK